MTELFSQYAAHGWRLTPITPGLKGPTSAGWNRPENMISHPKAAEQLQAAGLCHVESGTCAIDIDDMEGARIWLRDRGVDLDALLAAPDAVQIRSPNKDRGKLIYSIPVPLPSKKIAEGSHTILEFRCASVNGLTVQDVLPPSPHPVDPDKQPGIIDGNYEWVGSWWEVPTLPDALFTLWSNLITAPTEAGGTVEATVTSEQLIAMLKRLNPDMGYQAWIDVGMAIHNEFGGSDRGLALWDTWSKQGTKYRGIQDLIPHWKSFKSGGGITALTLESMVPWSISDMPDNDRLQAINAAVPNKVNPIFGRSAAELLAPVDLPPFLVRGLLEHGADASLIGPAKSGKSLFALELSVRIATGTPFFNRETEQGLVVYLCGEGQRGLSLRSQALRHARDLDFSGAPLHVVPRGFPLAVEQGVKSVQHLVREAEQRYNRKLALLVVDTYGRYSSGEENVAEDLYEFFRAARLCAGDAALLVVHHTGHSDSSRGRGTSAWEQLVDTEFVAQIRQDTGSLMFENTKQKDAEPASPMFFKLATHMTDSTRVGEPIYSVVLEPTIMEAAPPKLGVNEKLVYDAVEESTGTVDEIIEKAVSRMPPPEAGKKDKRRYYIERAIKAMVGKKVLTISGECLFRYGDPMAEFIGATSE